VHLLLQLWLPIVLSAALVFVLSAVIHMAPLWRRTEWGRLADSTPLQAALRGVPPGLYGFPAPPDRRDRMTKEWLARWEAGPSGWLALEAPGPMAMGRKLALSFLAYLGIALLVGYVASLSLGPATPTLTVVRVVSTTGFLAYAAGTVFNSIWYARPWRTWAFDALDALIYGFAMAGVFASLWPR